jgi:hypothetical protein
MIKTFLKLLLAVVVYVIAFIITDAALPFCIFQS